MKEKNIIEKQKQDYLKSINSILNRIEENKHKAITKIMDTLLEDICWIDR